jgi:nitrogen fixation protein NifX
MRRTRAARPAHRRQLARASDQRATPAGASCCAPASPSMTGSVAMRARGSAIAARGRPCSISPTSSSGTTMTFRSTDRSTVSSDVDTLRARRRLALIWSANSEAPSMLRVAFASSDRSTVNQHFGAAEGFAVYALDGERARLVEIVEFPPTALDANEASLPARVAALAGVRRRLLPGRRRFGGEAAAGCRRATDPARRRDGNRRRCLWQISRAIRAGGIGWVDKASRAQPVTTRASIACSTKAGRNDGGPSGSPRPGGRSCMDDVADVRMAVRFELPELQGTRRLH